MRSSLKYDTSYLEGHVSDKDISGVMPRVEEAHRLLSGDESPFKGYLGWMDLPETVGDPLLKDIERTAGRFRDTADAVIIVGIGGSYLGARAAIETLAPDAVGKSVFFAGHNLCARYICGLLEKLEGRQVAVNVISKSGTTTETAVAFRFIDEFLKKKYGRGNYSDRVVCTTDEKKGALRAIADEKGYKSFVIPGDVGGRFSVLTPVGLFPISCAGIDIKELVEGAGSQRSLSLKGSAEDDISSRYAAVRNVLYGKGKRIEILSSFDVRLHYLDEWWKQLFGESEGKGGKSLFPASCDFSTDLHSMGQLIQEGERNLFETFLVSEEVSGKCPVPRSEDDPDGLNYLAGRQLEEVNITAYRATAEAHFEGGVPNSTIFFGERSPFTLGQLFYFFERAVAVSACLFGVDPFDQPGVEAYKKKMFKLLGKPGA